MGREGQEDPGNLEDGAVHPGTDVVHLAAAALGGQEPVGAGDIAHVGEVPPGVEVAHPDGGVARALVVHDPAGDRRGDELVVLAGTEMVEAPGPHHREVVGEAGGQAHHVGRRLARAVGTDRADGLVLRERQVGGGDRSVDVGAGDGQDPFDTGRHAGVEDVDGALHVDPEGGDRVLPRTADVGLGGEVIDDRRRLLTEVGCETLPVGDVHRGLHDVVTMVAQVSDEVSADEAVGAGDESPHAATTLGLAGLGNHPIVSHSGRRSRAAWPRRRREGR